MKLFSPSALFPALLLALFLSSTSEGVETFWGMNDVSILMPIQESRVMTELLSLEAEGSRGALLPHSVFDSLPRLLPGDQETTRGRMRAVAMRIDPCFPRNGNSRDCERQLRLIWQPLRVREASAGTWSYDAAVHTFYALDSAEFERLLFELALVREASGEVPASLPLQVHPTLARQGLGGEFHRELKRIILTNAGASNLVRMTFMTNHANGAVWNFGAFEIRNGKAAPLLVPRIGERIQRFVNHPFPTRDFFTAGMNPAPQGDDTLGLLVRPSKDIDQYETKEILTAFRAAVRIENPRHFNAETMDCVSCHIAQAARHFAVRRFPNLSLEESARSQTYASRHFSLTNLSREPHVTMNLRAFGYFEKEPAISQRVIHESAEVADLLNRK